MNKNIVEIDLFRVLSKLIERKFEIIIIASFFMIFSVIYTLYLPNIYKSSVTLLPQKIEAQSSKFSGLAELAGINLNTSEISYELFYQDVIKSNLILDSLILIKWQNESSEYSNLADFLGFEIDNSHQYPVEKLKYDLKNYLKEQVITFNTSKENGLMTLSVFLPKSSKMAADIANWLSNQLHSFNESFRQGKAEENLNSVEKQVVQARLDLNSAENSLRDFQMKNKNIGQSPELQLMYARLEREVITENTVYTELRKQYELAKIEVQKTKHSISILDKAIIPVVKDSPKRAIICISITMFGFFIAIIIVLFRIRADIFRNI